MKATGMKEVGMMLLSQAAQALGARLIGEDVRFVAVSSDSRNIQLGDLFIALRGEKFDGYEFVARAAQDGAVAALINADSYAAHPPLASSPYPPVLVVEDTRIALGQLAAYWRNQFDIPLVAVTGSNGKTTVKEMLASILRAAAGREEGVLATQGNFNNDIGMPLTLLKLNAQHRYAVIEMGMNHPGEIDYLTRIACPDVALITNASGAHLEGLGSVEAVARAKGEIFAGLKHHGSAVINADDDHAPLWRTLAGSHTLLEFGLGGMTRCAQASGAGMPPPRLLPQSAGSAITSDLASVVGSPSRMASSSISNVSEADQPADVAGQWQPQGAGLHLNAQTPSGNFGADLQVPGAHNARNALAATAAAIALNVPLEIIVAGLEKFGGVAGRLQRKAARHGAVLIDDTYNANPASMRAAIGVLAQSNAEKPGAKRVLVIGDMGELGDNAAALHTEIGSEVRRAGIEKLYALGALSANAVREFGSGARHFERLEDLQDALELELDADTTVLVKGSRFMKMERVVAFCASEQEAQCCSH
ncbi:MAG: UDP-N-acetylmuramoyl-tripeptide--D-alanyl-D-alanine ligase [Gallionellales bacterium GWA2_60_18]|nr:MAG: UDP-N-acetylmuramoyl-tripeptide--D-alanyl-D-alanine ligase [Gallionellales bacterium GWA2_60_18]